MPSILSQDEYSAIPDIVDFSVIPDVVFGQNTQHASQQRAQEDPFDEFDLYNETHSFAGIDLDAIPELRPPVPPATDAPVPVPPPPNASSQPTQPTVNARAADQALPLTQAASVASTQYTFDELGPAAWLQIDEIERTNATEQSNRKLS